MLNKAEPEETRLFCHIFIIGSISIGGEAGPLTPWLRLLMSNAFLGDGKPDKVRDDESEQNIN